MDYIKVIENLGKEIAEFMLEYGDTYEFRDCYEDYGNESFNEMFITETIKTLYDTVKRNIMALYLKDIMSFSDYDDEALKAAELYRKVVELC